MGEKDKIKTICKPYAHEQYENIDLCSLASYTIQFLKDNNVFLNFENVAVSLFLMFPKKFCMVNYEEYPDTNRINRTVNLQLRPKYQNLAFGDPQKGYSLTTKGKATAEQVRKILTGVSKQTTRITRVSDETQNRTRSLEDEVYKKITSKPLYQKYKKDNNSVFEKIEIYEFLSASPYTSKNALREYFKNLKVVAEKANDKEAMQFLSWLDARTKNIFGG